MKSESTELPDCIISHIFSKLSLKNLVKTSVLSKQWYHEWGLRKDLNFDLHNIFDYNTLPELPKTLPLFQNLQSQFAACLDNFVQKYPGDMIRSIRVNFPIGRDHTYTIDRLIHKGIAKGVDRIELLFANGTNFKIKQYNFLFPFLSICTYLHLQSCNIAATMEFSRLKNLRTLVLNEVPVELDKLQDLCFSCIHLESLTLNECPFLSDFKITSPTLLHLNIYCRHISTSRKNIDIIAPSLLSSEYCSTFFTKSHKVNIDSPMLSKLTYRSGTIFNLELSVLTNVTTIVLDGLYEGDVITHLFSKCLQLEDVTINMCRFTCDLNIISAKLRHLSLLCCYHENVRTCKIDINAPNLSSFEYIGDRQMGSIISIDAPKLLKVFWDAGFNKINIYNFATIPRLHQPENLPMHMSLSQISELMKECFVQSRKLRQLELFMAGAYNLNKDYFWILDIEMPSQHPQKLSLTIRN